jgi:hypothetical protein
MTPTPTPRVAPEHGLIIINCSQRKLTTSVPVPAWDLYQGACVPQLRAQFAGDPAHRARVRILSAQHGLLHPDDPINTYDRRLETAAEAIRLHEQTVRAHLDAEFAMAPALRQVLIIVEPLYLLALQRLYDHLNRLAQVVIIPNPGAWQDGLTVLRQWGWA